MLEELKEKVYKANMELPKNNLVKLTWGNVSELDRESGLFVIKPSGVSYDLLSPEDMVVIDLQGRKVEGKLNPSSDTPTHAYLYSHWKQIGGIIHTHSRWATIFAQAGIDIPAAGTTHADSFYGPVPVTEQLTKGQVDNDYELNTGLTIIKTFEKRGIDPLAVPAVLANDHGPFAWGKDSLDAVHNGIILDFVADMAYHTLKLHPDEVTVPQYLLDRHYFRKHGKEAYYGQTNR